MPPKPVTNFVDKQGMDCAKQADIAGGHGDREYKQAYENKTKILLYFDKEQPVIADNKTYCISLICQ